MLGIAALATVLSFALARPRIGWKVVIVVAFWTVVPPAWFFFEYYMVDHDWIRNLPMTDPGGREAVLASVKTYADYASKVWAAVAVAVLFQEGLTFAPPRRTCGSR